MTISDLFKTRQSIYYKKMSKYLKYVLNDHFVILLLVLGGASGLAYQNYLNTIQIGAVVPRVILTLVVLLVVFSGSIRTLVKPADAVFLLPKEKEFNAVMNKNLTFSLIFHSVYTVIIGFLTVPLLTAIEFMAPERQLYWVMTLVFLKNTHGLLAYYSLKQHRKEVDSRIRYIINSLSFTGILVGLFGSVLSGFIISAVTLGLFSIYVLILNRSENWNWEILIEMEQKRTQKIYSIINMFIETPYSKHKVKRLKFLDFFYELPLFHKSPEIYYLSRMFVRNYNFSGLYLRLILIGSIAIYFSENWMINAAISALFLYLIGFQLIPLRQTFNKSVYFNLYPNTDTDKINTIQQLIMILLAGSALVYSLASFNSGWITMGMLLFINSIFIWLFIYGYLPRRLRK